MQIQMSPNLALTPCMTIEQIPLYILAYYVVHSIPKASAMDCLVMPVTMLRKRSLRSPLGYQPLYKDQEQQKSPITVVVGKEEREFLVDPFVLEEFPFRALMKMDVKADVFHGVKDRVFLLDVDAILFEHLLWLMENDCSALFQLNLQDILDFYTQDW